MATKAKKVKVEPLTAEEKQQVIDACRKSWEYIKYEAMDLVAGESEEPYMTQSEVGEMAADASRPCEHGLSKELYHKFCIQPEKVANKILREAFPQKRYYL